MFSTMFLNSAIKTIDIYDAKILRNDNTKTYLLFSEKFFIISYHFCVGSYLLPFKLLDKINLFEIKKRNHSYEQYYGKNRDRNTFDEYLFS